MDVRFPYRYEGKGVFGSIYRPVAKVSLKSPKFNSWTTVWMVVDTGADFTILPKYLALDLGISLKKDCLVDTTKGVGGIQTIYLVKDKLAVKIGKVERNIPIAFFSKNDLPPLLGRLGFLESFDTQFLKSHIVIFKNH